MNWFLLGIYLKGTHQDPKLTSKGTEGRRCVWIEAEKKGKRTLKIKFVLDYRSNLLYFLVEKLDLHTNRCIFFLVFSLHTFIYVCSNYLHVMKSEVLVTQSCPTLWHQGLRLQSMGFSRHEYWSGLPFSSPGDIPHPGNKPESLHCRRILYGLSHQGSPVYMLWLHVIFTFDIQSWS